MQIPETQFRLTLKLFCNMHRFLIICDEWYIPVSIGTFATADRCSISKEMSVRLCCADTDTGNSLREWEAALIGFNLRGFPLEVSYFRFLY